MTLRRIHGVVSVIWLLGVVLAVPNRALAQNPVHWTLSAPRTMAPGAAITATLTAQIDEGWYIYALSQKPGGPIPMHVALPKGASRFTLGAITTSTPAKRKFDPNFQMETEIHQELASYDVKATLATGTPPGKNTLRLVVTFQTCNERLCLPPKDEELAAEIGTGTGELRGTGESRRTEESPGTSPSANASPSSAAARPS